MGVYPLNIWWLLLRCPQLHWSCWAKWKFIQKEILMGAKASTVFAIVMMFLFAGRRVDALKLNFAAMHIRLHILPFLKGGFVTLHQPFSSRHISCRFIIQNTHVTVEILNAIQMCARMILRIENKVNFEKPYKFSAQQPSCGVLRRR